MSYIADHTPYFVRLRSSESAIPDITISIAYASALTIAVVISDEGAGRFHGVTPKSGQSAINVNWELVCN